MPALLASLGQMELTLLDGIQQLLGCSFLDVVMPLITFLGNGGWVWIVAGVVLLFIPRYRYTGVTLLCGLLCGLLIGNVLLKLTVARPRPCWINPAHQMLIGVPSDYSFPSGHTLASVIAATVLTLRDRRFGLVAIPLTVLIAFSRLYLYVHFPSDVLVGALLGVLIGIGVTAAVKALAAKAKATKAT